MLGITRGFATLVGVAVAGFLVWLATQIGTETTGEYWATYGVVAAAGLSIALSQLLGGWTKWGWPRLSLGVFLLGFLPALVAGGWVLLARQPADWMNTSNWSRDLGIYGAVADLGNLLPALAFGLGLVFGLVFDTSGPRVHRTTVHDDAEVERTRPAIVHHDDGGVTSPVDRAAADEPLTAEREDVRDAPHRDGLFGRRRHRVPATTDDDR